MAHGLLGAGRHRPRVLVLGGEAVPDSLWQALRAVPEVSAYDFYGPTECTVGSTGGALDDSPTPVIGRPMDHADVHILDEHLGPVPPGVVGELYIGGGGLARGYLGRPGLTAERFVPDPFGGSGQRLYRTGDLGRWTAAGAIDYVGRADQQVKVRGFRIELGEVQSVLARHPGVAQVAVVDRDEGDGDRRLVAYVVGPATAAQLRAHARASLPEHMVPAAFTSLDALPLTDNGKLDRSRLPAPQYAPARVGRAPATTMEEQLCALFADVLRVEEVGPEDGFFELGGHSLLAARLVGRIRSALGVDLGVHTVFQAPTAAELAERCGRRDDRRALDVLLPLRTAGDQPALFCVHPGGALSWPYASILPYVPAGHPVYGIQARGLLAGDPLPGSVEEMVEDYLATIRSVQPTGPYHLLGWSAGGVVAHALAGRIDSAGDEVGLLAVLDGYPRRSGCSDTRPVSYADILAGLGFDSRSTAATTRAGFVADLRRLQPELDGLDDAALDRLAEAMVNGRRIGAAFRSPVVRAGLTLFVAGDGPVDHRAAAEAWQPHVTGPVDLRTAPGGHRDMCRPAAMAVVGPLVARRLSGAGDEEEAGGDG